MQGSGGLLLCKGDDTIKREKVTLDDLNWRDKEDLEE